MTERKDEVTQISPNQVKVPLAPGRGLSSWNRIVRKGTNVSGVDPRRPVAHEELIQHKTREDCWIAFRGMVYNCTPYMEYHPGGADELMKSAGDDGTERFNQVHRWVNLERLLAPCLIGPYILPKDKQSSNKRWLDEDMSSSDTNSSSSPKETRTKSKFRRRARKRANPKTSHADSDAEG